MGATAYASNKKGGVPAPPQIEDATPSLDRDAADRDNRYRHPRGGSGAGKSPIPDVPASCHAPSAADLTAVNAARSSQNRSVA